MSSAIRLIDFLAGSQDRFLYPSVKNFDINLVWIGAAHEERKLNGSNGAKKPNEIEYLRREVRRLTDELEAIEANAIVALKERSAKGRSHKGTAFTRETRQKSR